MSRMKNQETECYIYYKIIAKNTMYYVWKHI